MEKGQQKLNRDEGSQKTLHAVENIRDSSGKYRKIVQAGIAMWVKEFQAGNIVMKTVDDLDKLIRMDLRLQRDNDREE